MFIGYAYFLLYFCTIHAISNACFWVRQLYFSALQLCPMKHSTIPVVHSTIPFHHSFSQNVDTLTHFLHELPSCNLYGYTSQFLTLPDTIKLWNNWPYHWTFLCIYSYILFLTISTYVVCLFPHLLKFAPHTWLTRYMMLWMFRMYQLSMTCYASN